MVRITAAQARKMGIKLNDSKPTKRPAKGRNRASRVVYEQEPIEFTISLPYDPKPKERPRTVVDNKSLQNSFLLAKGNPSSFMDSVSKRSSRTFTPKQTIDYERVISDEARFAMLRREMFTCPVETSIIFVLKGDTSVWPTSKLDGDADNLEKSVLDALNGIVFEDDRLVVKSTREKKCGEHPHIIIRVAPATP